MVIRIAERHKDRILTERQKDAIDVTDASSTNPVITQKAATALVTAVINSLDPQASITHGIDYVKAGTPIGAGATDGEKCLDTVNHKLHNFSGGSWDAGAAVSQGDRFCHKDTGTDASGDSGTHTKSDKIYNYDTIVSYTEIVPNEGYFAWFEDEDQNYRYNGTNWGYEVPSVHAIAGSIHNASTLANLNTKVSDATLIDTGDSRLSDARTPLAHNLAGGEHNADTLANLNAKVSDAILAALSGALTVGSIPFADSAGKLDQDNTNLLWDNTGKKLGIGISPSVAKVEIKENVTSASDVIPLRVEGDNLGTGDIFTYFFNWGGTAARANLIGLLSEAWASSATTLLAGGQSKVTGDTVAGTEMIGHAIGITDNIGYPHRIGLRLKNYNPAFAGHDLIRAVGVWTDGLDLSSFGTVANVLRAAADCPIVLGGQTLQYGSVSGKFEFNDAIEVQDTGGITIGDGADTDQDLLTVDVTGTPKVWWDEATDSFETNKPLTLGGPLSVGGIQVVGSQQAAEADVAAPSAITTTGTADGTYDATEQTMLNNLKADVGALKTEVTNLTNKINALLAKQRTHGLIAT